MKLLKMKDAILVQILLVRRFARAGVNAQFPQIVIIWVFFANFALYRSQGKGSRALINALCLQGVLASGLMRGTSEERE
jgi:hypothetical protein